MYMYMCRPCHPPPPPPIHIHTQDSPLYKFAVSCAQPPQGSPLELQIYLSALHTPPPPPPTGFSFLQKVQMWRLKMTMAGLPCMRPCTGATWRQQKCWFSTEPTSMPSTPTSVQSLSVFYLGREGGGGGEQKQIR